MNSKYKITNKNKIFLLNTGCGPVYPHKKWTKDGYIKLVNELLKDKNNIIILTGSTSEKERNDEINKNIDNLDSKTGYTPAMPAGHAFQAYYLAAILSKRYPHKKQKFDEIAKKCDDCRVKAGIHYPSDGVFSKKIVNYLNDLKII